MNIKTMLDRELTEAEKINKEIFGQSTNCKYYNLGLAQGLAYACKLASRLEKSVPFEDWANYTRKQYITRDLLDYFDRLINEYKRGNNSED